MRRRVLFAGDANVDLILSGLASPPAEDREVFCRGFETTLGGSTAIAAAAYARLGGKAEFCGLVGKDEYGELVRSRLAEAGAGISMLRASRESGTGVTVNLARASTRTQITYPGTLAIMDESAAALGRLGRCAHLHISGAYGTPRFLPRIAELLRAARGAGLSTSLDTQWDPSELWPGLDEWLPLLSYLFVNEDEAASIARLLGGKGGAGSREKRDAAENWRVLAGRTACPIVKLGARGAYAGGKAYAPLEVEVVDATGAGDTFAAGFIFATVEEGKGLDEAMSFAQAAGALACTYAGGASAALRAERVRGMAR